MNMRVILKGLKRNCQAKKSFIVHCRVKKISDKDFENAVRVWNKFEIKAIKDYHDLHLKCAVFY